MTGLVIFSELHLSCQKNDRSSAVRPVELTGDLFKSLSSHEKVRVLEWMYTARSSKYVDLGGPSLRAEFVATKIRHLLSSTVFVILVIPTRLLCS